MASLIRIFSFVRKETVDVVRQPMLLLALIVGPFLILLAFGAGLRESDPPLQTAFIVADESEVRDQVERFVAEARDSDQLQVAEVSADRTRALHQLRGRELDLVIVFPDEISDSIEQGERAVIELHHNQIDPVESQAIQLFSRSAVDEINNQILETLISDLQEAARDVEAAGATEAADDPEVEHYLQLDPAVVVRPFRGEISAVAGQDVELTDFYAPAVIIVLLQHLAVTLLGLSVVRERALGATELYRASPLRTGEYLAGKFVAYLLLGSVVAAALVGLLVYGLGVPMQGSWWQLAATIGVLLFTSIALGLVLSMLANTDSQAVQYAMLVLLATIFLSGFLLSLERFVPVAQPLPWVLPATYGIRVIRDVMLRGTPLDPVVIGGLALYGVVFAVLGARLAAHRLRRPVS